MSETRETLAEDAREGEVKYLREVFLFKGLTDEQLSEILSVANLVKVPAGHIFIKEATKGDALYVIREGEVEVSRSLTIPLELLSSTRQEKALSRLSDRDRAVFGEMVLFDEQARSATVRCLTDCSFYELKKEAFLKLAEQNVEIGYHLFKNLAQMVSERLRRSTDDVVKLATALSIAIGR
ncbi:MAG: cyclic nucleotide-binding domain-containing protein [Proteobacteria bacterium]|nr:cyclic nucleotide-binding domain-containing protein [Pseudomonadota bacterium]